MNARWAEGSAEIHGPETRLYESERALETLFATLSHELRTPMTVVMGILELMLKSPRPEEDRLLLERAHASGEQLLRSAKRILEYAMLHHGGVALKPEEYPFAASLKELLASFEARAEELGLDYQWEVSELLPTTVFADRVRIEQALTELIVNALTFTPKGMVKVSVQFRETWEARTRVLFSVEDTGRGIDAAIESSIFQPLLPQGRELLPGSGSGLGLATAKRLIEAMGGQVGFESKRDHGSRFWFILNLCHGAEAHPVSLSEAAVEVNEDSIGLRVSRDRLSRKILVADDNPFNRELLLRALQGYPDVAVVSTGRDAVEAVTRGGFGLVLMDCQMPDIDGLEATRLIRAVCLNHVPIVAVTAKAMPGDRERCVAAGMDEYLAKPFDIDTLREVVARYVGPSAHAQSAETLPPLAQRKPGVPARSAEELGVVAEKHPIISNLPLKSGAPSAVPIPVDLARLAQLSLEAGSNDLVVELSEIFLSDTEQRIARISEALATSDFELLFRSAHTIKGAAGSFGAPEVAAIAHEIEVYGKLGDERRLGELLAELRSAFQAVKDYLRQAILPGRTDTMPSPKVASHVPTETQSAAESG